LALLTGLDPGADQMAARLFQNILLGAVGKQAKFVRGKTACCSQKGIICDDRVTLCLRQTYLGIQEFAFGIQRIKHCTQADFTFLVDAVAGNGGGFDLGLQSGDLRACGLMIVPGSGYLLADTAAGFLNAVFFFKAVDLGLTDARLRRAAFI